MVIVEVKIFDDDFVIVVEEVDVESVLDFIVDYSMFF